MKLQLANTLTTRVERRSVLRIMPDLKRLRLLTEVDRQEVTSFLKVRPVHTVVMSGWIADNGIENELNRGRFYGYRNGRGTLEGVALIGHTTLIEARSEEALIAFAAAAKMSETPIHVVMSDADSTEIFWRHFAGANQKPRLVCTELLFELTFPFLVQECTWNIRSAKIDELEQIAEAHAEVALIESGVDPLEKDREGFLKRTLRRIEKERTFVVFDNGKLVFKADIAAETEDVIYLEGIYVAPEYRGKGVASSCLSSLSRQLLSRGQNICLLSNIEFEYAHRSFLKAGYKKTDSCQTIFV
jgi:uncharacterized protein